MSPENTQSHNNKNISILIVVAILLIVIAYSIMKLPFSDQKQDPNVSWADTSAENQMDRLPKGFPQNIPVEIDNLEESYSIDYEEGVTQSVVSFYTATSADDAFFLYEYFMTEEGYDFGPSGKSPTDKTLRGSKNGNDLTVIVGTLNEGVFVQINYLNREGLIKTQQNERK